MHLVGDDDGDQVILRGVGVEADVLHNGAGLQDGFDFAVGNVPGEKIEKSTSARL